MPDKRTMPWPDGTEKEIQPIGYRPTTEQWNEYFLEDGSVVRAKLVATEISRVEGEWDADGNPTYVLRSTTVLAVSSPQSLRKPK
jgi:hypothetical protein